MNIHLVYGIAMILVGLACLIFVGVIVAHMVYLRFGLLIMFGAIIGYLIVTGYALKNIIALPGKKP